MYEKMVFRKFEACKIKQENRETYFTTNFGNPTLNVVYCLSTSFLWRDSP